MMDVDPKDIWNQEYWTSLQAGKDVESCVRDAEAAYHDYLNSLAEEADSGS
jgi:hypothetical protein